MTAGKPGPEKLTGKVAIVTGASRGIGHAIARLFALEGAKVVINYRGSERKAIQLAKEIGHQRGESLLVKADVSSSKDVKNMIAKVVTRFGRIDILANNAGVLIDEDIPNSSEESWDRVVGVNLKGAFLCCEEVTPAMRKQRKGNIINISSISGLSQHSAVQYPDYVASKAGLIGLTRSLAVNLGPSIRVNAIAPGVIETDMTTSMSRSRRKAMKEEALLKRLRGPEEIAKAALFLASDESDFVTDVVITVSGGRGMR